MAFASASASAPYQHLDTAGLRVWLLAAMVVGALHVAGLAFVLSERDEVPAFDTSGVVTVELAPISTSVREEVPDAAPGKLMQEAPTTPEQAEKKEEKLPDGMELEKAPLAPEPAVTLPDAKPQPDKPEEARQETAEHKEKSEASVGDVTTSAPQKIDAPVSTTTAAPVAGSDRVVLAAQQAWQKALVARIETRKRYPAEARAHGEQGTAKVQFLIDRKGNLVQAEITQSSGHAHLDAEALAVLKRASPLPAPPASIPGETVLLTLPLNFTIKRN